MMHVMNDGMVAVTRTKDGPQHAHDAAGREDTATSTRCKVFELSCKTPATAARLSV